MSSESIEEVVSKPNSTAIAIQITISIIALSLLVWVIIDVNAVATLQKNILGQITNNSEKIKTEIDNRELSQKHIMDKLTNAISSIEDIKKHEDKRDNYLQSLVARIESHSIPEKTRKKYLDQLGEIKTLIAPKEIPLKEDEYSTITKKYKEYIFSVPMYIQDSEIRDLMRIKALLRLSDVLHALTDTQINPQQGNQELDLIMGQYGDLFDQDETDTIDEKLKVAIESWHSKRSNRAQVIIDDFNKQTPKSITEEFLHSVEDKLFDYSDIESIQEYLTELRTQVWNSQLDAAVKNIESIKKDIQGLDFSEKNSEIINKKLLTTISSYIGALVKISENGEVWTEEQLPARLSDRRLAILRQVGAIQDTLESLQQTMKQLEAITSSDRIDDEDKIGALRLLQANNTSAWLVSDTSLLEMVEYVKNIISKSSSIFNEKIQKQARNKHAAYVSKAIEIMSKVEMCFDDHDEDWNKKVFSEAMLHIKTEQLPMPVYRMFQSINSKIQVDENDLLEVAQYSVRVSRLGKKIDQAKRFVNMGCSR